MAEIVLKAPWVAPGCHYFHATEPGETTNIPDAWVCEVPPGTIVVKATSAVSREPAPAVGTLLREHDWLRKATPTEVDEVLKLRQPEPQSDNVVQPVTRRRANVIPGSKV